MRSQRRAFARGAGAAVLASLCLSLSAAAPADAQFQPRVIGGSATTIGQYPWQAALVVDPSKATGDPFQRQFCGGSLITAQIVMTAGHCVDNTDPDNGSDLDADDVNVVLGQTTLSGAPTSSEFDVQGVALHPGYDGRYGPASGVPSNDIAYLVLQSAYGATTPIDIAGPGEEGLWDAGSLEQITGWGATATSGPGSGGSDTLRHATVPIVSDVTCAGDYGSYFNGSTMVCAGYPEGGVDTCFGDSGGPMQAAMGGGVYRLVGITSWGAGCAEPNAPGVYTRVAAAGMRAAIASEVFDLETTFGLPHEDITGGTDDDPPETSLISGPSGFTNDSTPTFGFSADEPGSSFECRFDIAAFALCSGPGSTHTPAAPLSDGAHTFAVKATDQEGNTDPTPASTGFTIDTVAPTNPSLSSSSHSPDVVSTDPTVTVSFDGSEDALSGVDGFSYLWNTSPGTTPDTTKEAEQDATGTTSPALADGSSHWFHLRTRDNAGNWSAAAHLGPFVIDTSLPPPPPPPPPPPADVTPPRGSVAAKPKLGAGGVVLVELGCDEACTATVTGLLIGRGNRAAGARKIPLAEAVAEIRPGASVTVRLRPKGRKARRGLAKLLRRGKRIKAKLGATFVDDDGNSAAETVTVRLKPSRRGG